MIKKEGGYSIAFEIDPDKLFNLDVNGQKLGASSKKELDVLRMAALCSVFSEKSLTWSLRVVPKRIKDDIEGSPYCVGVFIPEKLQAWQALDTIVFLKEKPNCPALYNYVDYQKTDSLRIELPFTPEGVAIGQINLIRELFCK